MGPLRHSETKQGSSVVQRGFVSLHVSGSLYLHDFMGGGVFTRLILRLISSLWQGSSSRGQNLCIHENSQADHAASCKVAVSEMEGNKGSRINL